MEGWYEDQALTRPFTYKTMPAQNLTAYPKWVADEISYYVSYIFLDGTTQVNSYTETYTGLADSVVQPPEVKCLEGYTFDESSRLTSFKIEPGNPYIGYYYQINTHTLTYQYETNDATGTNIITAQKKYGEDITIPDPARDRNAFAGWYTDAKCTKEYKANMPDQDLSRYGLIGSPTSVEKMFAPEESEKQVYLEGTAKEKADKLVAILTGKKII